MLDGVSTQMPFQTFHHWPNFEQGFLIFLVGIGVSHDAAAAPEEKKSAVSNPGADGNIRKTATSKNNV
ncbi:MAG: hypothetical protein RLN85_03865, partial [Pseudomonadales bacterium]